MKYVLMFSLVSLITGCATVFESQSALISQEDAKHIQCSAQDLVGMQTYISACEKVPEYKSKSASYCFDRAIIALCGSKNDKSHQFTQERSI